MSYLNLKVKKKIKVYLYGFDFKKNSNDEDIEKKQINKQPLQQLIDVNSQLIAFKIIRNTFKYLKIYRMGFSQDDDLNPKTFNLLKNP